MKRSLLLGRVSHKYIINAKLSVTAKSVETRPLKLESEQQMLINHVLPSIMLNKTINSSQDWKNIRAELLNTGKVSHLALDTTILKFCIASENRKLGFQYMEFLKQENIKPSLAAHGRHFMLLYLDNKDKDLDESTELKIISMYKELHQNYKILDYVTCENVIPALSLTHEWKECLKLLEEIKITSTPSVLTFSILVASAFKNDDFVLGWKLLNDIIDNNKLPDSVAFVAYLNKCEESPHDFIKKTNILFNFFQLHHIKCDVEVARKIYSSYKKLKLKAETSLIKNRGFCFNCKQNLTRMELTEQDFEELKATIFKKVIIGSDIFCKSTPEELKRFEYFIKNMKKYDVVIDGLNVAYSVGTNQPIHVLSALIVAVIKHFADQNKSVLLLGRTHMKNWYRKNWVQVERYADTFLTQSLSQDDPYLLYCALNCGMNTIIVTRDMMRNHSFRLDNARLKLLFNQWLTQNCYYLQYVNHEGQVFFKYPLPYTKIAQKLNNVWHIPFDVPNKENAEVKWLCLKNT